MAVIHQCNNDQYNHASSAPTLVTNSSQHLARLPVAVDVQLAMGNN
jgi:hypothetical protein